MQTINETLHPDLHFSPNINKKSDIYQNCTIFAKNVFRFFPVGSGRVAGEGTGGIPVRIIVI